MDQKNKIFKRKLLIWKFNKAFIKAQGHINKIIPNIFSTIIKVDTQAPLKI